MRGVFLLVVVLATPMLGIGCGGTTTGDDPERLDKAEYLAELGSIGKEAQAGLRASVETNFVTPNVDELGDAWDAYADRVEGLRPPAEVQEAHDKLVAGLRDSAEIFHQHADAIEEEEKLDPLEALFRSVELRESDTLKKARRAFEDAGYEIPAVFV